MSMKYKTQCPPAGGGSRCWDWFGIPLGRRVRLGAENPARERGERLALDGAVRSVWDYGLPEGRCCRWEFTEPFAAG